MFCTPQVPTVFVNHVVPFQHTNSSRDTDFRRKVTPKIGVTTQNSWHLAHNRSGSPKLTLRRLRDKLPDSFNINHKLFQIHKEDGTTAHTELCDRHTYMLNAKYNRKTFENKMGNVVGTRELHYIQIPGLYGNFGLTIFTSTLSSGTVSHLSSTFYLAA